MTENSYLVFVRGLVIQLASAMATFERSENVAIALASTNSTGLAAKQLQ